MTNTIFVSTTIPYVNAKPHLGHAFEFLIADVYTRFYQQMGFDVYLLTGSDENSLKNVLAAEREGIPVQQLVDRNVVYFQQLVADLHLDNDHFIRTSVDEEHRRGASRVWELMAERGDIYSKEYTGLYCVGCEQFYTVEELADGKCPEHLVEPELVSERNYFFCLSNYQDQILDVLKSGQIKVVPETRLNEVVSFVQSGLTDISISRSMTRARGWGIPVPGDNTQVMYVWIDALTNYITALRWIENNPQYKTYWEEAQKRIHVVGKGVIRFHAVYWPAMLLSAGLPLPSDIVVHGYITAQGLKISKSLGNSVDIQGLLDRYGMEAVRYYFLADFSPFSDGDFSEDRLLMRYNTDLANDLGNLVNRVLSMITRYRKGVIPSNSAPGESETSLGEQVAQSRQSMQAAMQEYDFRIGLARIWELIRRTNMYLNETAPWHLAKAEDKGDAEAAARLDTVLHHATGAIFRAALLLEPFLPTTSRAILTALGSAEVGTMEAAWDTEHAGITVAELPVLFPRKDRQEE